MDTQHVVSPVQILRVLGTGHHHITESKFQVDAADLVLERLALSEYRSLAILHNRNTILHTTINKDVLTIDADGPS
jgi:hypothetical protein